MFKGRDLLKLKKKELRDFRGDEGRDGLPGPDDVAETRCSGFGEQLGEAINDALPQGSPTPRSRSV